MKRFPMDRKQLERLIRSGKTDHEPPDGLADRVRAAMAASPVTERPRRRRLGRAGKVAALWAAAAAVALVGAAVVRQPGAEQLNAPAGIESGPLVSVIAARQPVTYDDGEPLAVGDRVRAGSAVRTGAGGRVTLITRRGSEFTLAADTELALNADGQSASLRAGRVYCRTRRSEFSAVETPAGSIYLLGTTVDAAVEDEQTVAVTVVEGKVRLSNAHGQALVDSGRKALLIASLPPEAGQPVNAVAETAWYDGRGEVVSDFGEIAYSIRRVPQLVSEVWAMNADGTGKHRVKSYVGSSWSPGPWVPGERTLMVSLHSPVWTFPDFEKRIAVANRGASMLKEWRRTWLLDVVTGQDSVHNPFYPFDQPSEYHFWDVVSSPDRTRVAFSGGRRTGPDPFKDYELGLWVCDLESGQLTKLLDGGWDSFAWSWDGSMIAASEAHSSNEDYELVLVDADDATVVGLGVRGLNATFSPDGNRIAYVDDDQRDYGDGTWLSDRGRIYVLDLVQGREPRLVSPATERSSRPRWSPDGQHLLYRVLYYRRGHEPGESPRSLVVAASDGTQVREVYNPGAGYCKQAAWAPSGDAIYVSTDEGLLVVDPDGSGLPADLGGTEEDSALSAAEQEQTEAAIADIQEAVFQYAVGKLREFEGKPAEAKDRYGAAADLFASLPWKYPLVGFSTSNVLLYAEELEAMAGRPDEAMQAATCKSHLNHLSLLLPWYANEHDGVFPRDFSELGQWTATKNEPDNEAAINEWQICRPEVAAATSKCSMGDAYVYTPPASGALPEVGDVLLTCPNHADFEIVWERNREGRHEGWLEPTHLEGFSVGPVGSLALEPRDAE